MENYFSVKIEIARSLSVFFCCCCFVCCFFVLLVCFLHVDYFYLTLEWQLLSASTQTFCWNHGRTTITERIRTMTNQVDVQLHCCCSPK